MDDAYYSFFRESREWLEGRDGAPPMRGGGHERFGTEPAHFAASGALEAGRRRALELGQSIRPDGELMLYLLSREFVAKPAIAVRNLAEPELGHLLSADVGRLVEQSVETKDGEEISAHSVIDSLSAGWKTLESSSLDIWGP